MGWTLTPLARSPLVFPRVLDNIRAAAVTGNLPIASRSGSSTSTRRRAGQDDDIPLATRSPHPGLAAPRPRGRGRAFVLGGLLAAFGAVALIGGPLRSRLQPTPALSLGARPAADGRLLGHFPYPEAPVQQLVTVAPGVVVRRDAAADLQALLAAAQADGIQLVVLSSFRNLDLQKQLFFDVKAQRHQSSLDRARVSAPPGYSEHSTGYAVDLGDGSRPDTHLAPAFETTPAFAWLQAHASSFHFLASFPRGNAQGVSYEPWHWRYEGSLEALKLFEPAQRLAASRGTEGDPLR